MGVEALCAMATWTDVAALWGVAPPPVWLLSLTQGLFDTHVAPPTSDNVMDVFVRILNAHQLSLEWLSKNSDGLEEAVARVVRQVDGPRQRTTSPSTWADMVG